MSSVNPPFDMIFPSVAAVTTHPAILRNALFTDLNPNGKQLFIFLRRCSQNLCLSMSIVQIDQVHFLRVSNATLSISKHLAKTVKILFMINCHHSPFTSLETRSPIENWAQNSDTSGPFLRNTHHGWPHSPIRLPRKLPTSLKCSHGDWEGALLWGPWQIPAIKFVSTSLNYVCIGFMVSFFFHYLTCGCCRMSLLNLMF